MSDIIFCVAKIVLFCFLGTLNLHTYINNEKKDAFSIAMLFAASICYLTTIAILIEKVMPYNV